jgi:hypothetical protein
MRTLSASKVVVAGPVRASVSARRAAAVSVPSSSSAICAGLEGLKLSAQRTVATKAVRASAVEVKAEEIVSVFLPPKGDRCVRNDLSRVFSMRERGRKT